MKRKDFTLFYRMILRSLLLFAILFVYNSANAQKKPSSSPKTATGSGGSGAGFRMITVPAYGDFKLGVEKAEFETTTSEFNNLLETGAGKYPVTMKSVFLAKRLFELKFTTNIQELDSLPRDIIAFFTAKYGKTDSSDISRREITANNINDSTNNDPVTIFHIYASWKFRYHSVNILMNYQEKKNGKYYGSTESSFSGNYNYFLLLKELEEKEIH